MASLADAFSGPWIQSEVHREASPHQWVMDIVERDGPGITRMLWRMLRNEADVLDAFQDTFCKLAQRGGDIDLRSARAYAYRTASNIGIELIRIRKRQGRHKEAIAAERARIVDQEETPHAESASFVGHERLRDAIGQLPPHLRGVIVLRDLARMAYDEVGCILGIDPATARVYRRHAIVKLAQQLEGTVEP